MIQRGSEILASFPGLLLALLIISMLGRPGLSTSSNPLLLVWHLRSLIAAIGMTFIFAATRVTRSATMVERHRGYVDAAVSCGASSWRVLWHHVLPNIVPYTIVAASTALTLAILLELSISFLGFGVPPGTPSWGADLSGPNRQYILQAPWLVLGPGAAIALTLLGFNLIGDALRDLADPRFRGNRRRRH
jgi:peptide/nickel transport system permease protein